MIALTPVRVRGAYAATKQLRSVAHAANWAPRPSRVRTVDVSFADRTDIL